jgi:hypothetical protein
MGANGVKCRVPERDSSKRMATMMEEVRISAPFIKGQPAKPKRRGGATVALATSAWKMRVGNGSFRRSLPIPNTMRGHRCVGTHLSVGSRRRRPS